MTDAQTLGFVMLIISILLSVIGLKRVGYLESKKFKTVYGDKTKFIVGRELAPLSMQRFLHRVILGLTDFIMISVSTVLFIWFRYSYGLFSNTTLSFEDMVSAKNLIIVSIVWIILFVLNNLELLISFVEI